MLRTPLLLALPLALAACGVTVAPADPGVTATGQLAIHAGGLRKLQAAITPWTRASIDHVVLALSAGTTAQGSLPIAASALGSNVTFANLRRNTTYTVVATAFASADASMPIDNAAVDASSCTTTFATTNDTAVAIGPIKLKLLDRVYSGSGSANLAVTDGTVSDDPATEAITFQ